MHADSLEYGKIIRIVTESYVIWTNNYAKWNSDTGPQHNRICCVIHLNCLYKLIWSIWSITVIGKVLWIPGVNSLKCNSIFYWFPVCHFLLQKCNRNTIACVVKAIVLYGLYVWQNHISLQVIQWLRGNIPCHVYSLKDGLIYNWHWLFHNVELFTLKILKGY